MYDGKIGLYLLEEIEKAKEAITEKEFDSAIHFLKEALATVNGMEETYSEETVKMCKLLGLCYRKMNMLEDGIKALSTAENLCRRLYLKRNDRFWSRELAVCYMNEAILYDSQKQMNESITLYENAIELFEKLGDRESRIKAMLSLGIAYCKMNDCENAEKLYEEAMDMIESDFSLENYRLLFYKMKKELLN